MKYYLAHHGIKGQKWGVRRYQNSDGTLTDAGRKRLKNYGDKEGWSDLDSEDQAAIIALGAYATAAVLSTIYLKTLPKRMEKKYAKAKIKYDKEIQQMYEKRDIEDISSIPKQNPLTTTEENMKLVNPTYPKKGSTSNCMLVTTAMAMREKGFDVVANTSSHGFLESNIDKLWKSEGQFKEMNSDIESTLRKEPIGSYGNLTVTWLFGGGHSIFWKNDNGTIRYIDGQNGEEYTISELESYTLSDGNQYSRLDNAEPDELVLSALRRAS